ncbi:cell division protein ZapA [Novosphingobium sp. KA1]|uniref:cell division protein ZapA n=1 Tax=Novosphingobium sp. (strain KA1) TaxID=164608 RepID=UPI001A8F0DD7|nr:cell division protein ZapA [Novosphingobium sp. KA1]QSR18871.1 cell division protein ZapA [Novosphingobium sp. KA1]
MSNVNLTIGGRSFTLACADGQEGHVEHLGRLIDEKAAAAGAVGQTETRMLLFAAIMLADEVHNLREQDAAPPPAPPLTSPPAPAASEENASLPPEMLDRLAKIADSIENLASLLEEAQESP